MEKRRKITGITESWNICDWKGPLEISSPTPLLKLFHVERDSQDYVLAAFEYL